MNIKESMEALLPVRRPMSGAAWKRMRAEVFTATAAWLAKSEQIFADQQARILELETLINEAAE